MRTWPCPFGIRLHAAALLIVAGCGVVSTAPGQAPAQGVAADSAMVAGTITRFHDALAAGDSTTALSLLADGVIILESGGKESKAQYRSGHLRSDIAFARAVKAQRGAPSVRVEGNTAWAASTSTTQGEYNGRAVDSSGAELMVLVRTPEGWRITAIHWSSRQRRTRGGGPETRQAMPDRAGLSP